MVGRRTVATLLATSLLGLGALAPATAVSATTNAEVIVRAANATAAAKAILAVDGKVTMPLPIVDGAVGVVPLARLDDLHRLASVYDVVPNAPVHFASGGAEPSGGPQSVFVREVNADKLWSSGTTGRGVRVALVDTGVASVPDLADRVVRVPHPADASRTAACVDFSGEGHCNDSYGHGTFVAGLIAGTGVSSGGVHRGVAPGAEIVSIKIAGRDGSADVTKVLAAIQWVVSFRQELNIRVLNLSLGTNSPISYRFDPLNYAVERAWRSGIAVVVSASNRGPAPGTISKPADDPLVITTGAVDDRGTPATSDDRMPAFSGRGPTLVDGLAKPDVVAPGGRVVSLRSPDSTIEQLVPGGGGGLPEAYRRGSGTSMSAGVVSGAIALILQEQPGWSPDRVKFALMATARKVAVNDPYAVGSGLIDAHAAARNAPAGLANQNVTVLSDGSGSIDGSRGDVRVQNHCTDFEKTATPWRCDEVRGDETAQGTTFNQEQYTGGDWTGSSWYQSQWNAVLGSSWYGSSWYGTSWSSGRWLGSSWYGNEDNTSYGMAIMGSSWYGAWE